MVEGNGNSSTDVNFTQMLQNPPNICNASSINGAKSCKCSSSNDDSFHEVIDQKADVNVGLEASREGGDVEKISPNVTVHTHPCISGNYINTQSNSSLSPEFSSSTSDCSSKQLGSSSIPLASDQTTVSSSLSPCLQVSAATQQQVAESKVAVIKEEPVPSSLTGISSSSFSQDIASVITADNTNIARENRTSISNFTPCSKCNSLLVCSCSKASASEVVPAVSALSSGAFCEGMCNTNGNVPNSPPPDVKPQIFPVVVSMILINASHRPLWVCLCSDITRIVISDCFFISAFKSLGSAV